MSRRETARAEPACDKEFRDGLKVPEALFCRNEICRAMKIKRWIKLGAIEPPEMMSRARLGVALGLGLLQIPIFWQSQTEIAIVEMYYQVFVHKLIERALNPRLAVKLIFDVASGSRVRAVFVHGRSAVRELKRARRSLSPILYEYARPRFSISKIWPIRLPPAFLPVGDAAEKLFVLRVFNRVVHLVIEVIRDSPQIEAVFRKDE